MTCHRFGPSIDEDPLVGHKCDGVLMVTRRWFCALIVSAVAATIVVFSFFFFSAMTLVPYIDEDLLVTRRWCNC